MINWTKIWIFLFGTTEFAGLDIGFWAALAACLLVICFMNLILWEKALSGRKEHGEKEKRCGRKANDIFPG